MARDLDIYENGRVVEVPLKLEEGPIKVMWQKIWDALQAESRITIEFLMGTLIGELPMAIQRVIIATILLFSDEQSGRDQELRKIYRGQLKPGKALREDQANALATAANGQKPFSFDEGVLAKRGGFADPAHTAATFFWLVYRRLEKAKLRETARMFGTAGIRHSGMGRR